MKYSLIVGGTRGLGLALAKESSARGITPIVTGRSAGDADVAASLPRHAVPIVLDLMDEASLEKAMHDVVQHEIDYFIWNAGIWSGKKPFRELRPKDIDALFATNVIGPMKALRRFHEVRARESKPYHLVVISSASAWVIRTHETVYCASKDAQAVFALNFAGELAEELPGSKTTIFYPGGMKTEMPKNGAPDQDVSGWMEPLEVAKVVWDEVLGQKEMCREVHLIRDKVKNDGSFFVEYGPKPKGIV